MDSSAFEIDSEFGGNEIGKIKPLFEKISPEAVAEFEAKYSGNQEKVFPLDLIVGRVEAVDNHPTAGDLFVLSVLNFCHLTKNLGFILLFLSHFLLFKVRFDFYFIF